MIERWGVDPSGSFVTKKNSVQEIEGTGLWLLHHKV